MSRAAQYRLRLLESNWPDHVFLDTSQRVKLGIYKQQNEKQSILKLKSGEIPFVIETHIVNKDDEPITNASSACWIYDEAYLNHPFDAPTINTHSCELGIKFISLPPTQPIKFRFDCYRGTPENLNNRNNRNHRNNRSNHNSNNNNNNGLNRNNQSSRAVFNNNTDSFLIESFITRAFRVVCYELRICKQPSGMFYKDDGGFKANHLTVEIEVYDPIHENKRVHRVKPKTIYLECRLQQENGRLFAKNERPKQKAKSSRRGDRSGRRPQQVLQTSDDPQIDSRRGFGEIDFRINEVSQNHHNNKFQLRIDPDWQNHPELADIWGCVTCKIQVKSKSPQKLQQASSVFLFLCLLRFCSCVFTLLHISTINTEERKKANNSLTSKKSKYDKDINGESKRQLRRKLKKKPKLKKENDSYNNNSNSSNNMNGSLHGMNHNHNHSRSMNNLNNLNHLNMNHLNNFNNGIGQSRPPALQTLPPSVSAMPSIGALSSIPAMPSLTGPSPFMTGMAGIPGIPNLPNLNGNISIANVGSPNKNDFTKRNGLGALPPNLVTMNGSLKNEASVNGNAVMTGVFALNNNNNNNVNGTHDKKRKRQMTENGNINGSINARSNVNGNVNGHSHLNGIANGNGNGDGDSDSESDNGNTGTSDSDFDVPGAHRNGTGRNLRSSRNTRSIRAALRSNRKKRQNGSYIDAESDEDRPHSNGNSNSSGKKKGNKNSKKKGGKKRKKNVDSDPEYNPENDSNCSPSDSEGAGYSGSLTESESDYSNDNGNGNDDNNDDNDNEEESDIDMNVNNTRTRIKMERRDNDSHGNMDDVNQSPPKKKRRKAFGQVPRNQLISYQSQYFEDSFASITPLFKNREERKRFNVPMSLESVPDHQWFRIVEPPVSTPTIISPSRRKNKNSGDGSDKNKGSSGSNDSSSGSDSNNTNRNSNGNSSSSNSNSNGNDNSNKSDSEQVQGPEMNKLKQESGNAEDNLPYEARLYSFFCKFYDCMRFREWSLLGYRTRYLPDGEISSNSNIKGKALPVVRCLICQQEGVITQRLHPKHKDSCPWNNIHYKYFEIKKEVARKNGWPDEFERFNIDLNQFDNENFSQKIHRAQQIQGINSTPASMLSPIHRSNMNMNMNMNMSINNNQNRESSQPQSPIRPQLQPHGTSATQMPPLQAVHPQSIAYFGAAPGSHGQGAAFVNNNNGTTTPILTYYNYGPAMGVIAAPGVHGSAMIGHMAPMGPMGPMGPVYSHPYAMPQGAMAPGIQNGINNVNNMNNVNSMSNMNNMNNMQNGMPPMEQSQSSPHDLSHQNQSPPHPAPPQQPQPPQLQQPQQQQQQPQRTPTAVQQGQRMSQTPQTPQPRATPEHQVNNQANNQVNQVNQANMGQVSQVSPQQVFHASMLRTPIKKQDHTTIGGIHQSPLFTPLGASFGASLGALPPTMMVSHISGNFNLRQNTIGGAMPQLTSVNNINNNNGNGNGNGNPNSNPNNPNNNSNNLNNGNNNSVNVKRSESSEKRNGSNVHRRAGSAGSQPLTHSNGLMQNGHNSHSTDLNNNGNANPNGQHLNSNNNNNPNDNLNMNGHVNSASNDQMQNHNHNHNHNQNETNISNTNQNNENENINGNADTNTNTNGTTQQVGLLANGNVSRNFSLPYANGHGHNGMHIQVPRQHSAPNMMANLLDPGQQAHAGAAPTGQGNTNQTMQQMQQIQNGNTGQELRTPPMTPQAMEAQNDMRNMISPSNTNSHTNTSPSVDTNMATAGGSVVTRAQSTNASEAETISMAGTAISAVSSGSAGSSGSGESGQQSVVPTQSVADSCAATVGDRSSVPPPNQCKQSLASVASDKDNISINDASTVCNTNSLSPSNNVNVNVMVVE